MKGLMGFFDKFSDSFNVGRIVFYSASGALLVLPFVMTVDLALRPHLNSITFGSRVLESTEIIWAAGDIPGWALVFASLVVGFLWASLVFVVVIDPLQEMAKIKILPERTYARMHPLLRNSDEEDYGAWLVAEYFRFVEVTAQLPLASVAASGIMAVYAAVFLAKTYLWSNRVAVDGVFAFFFFLVACGLGYFWGYTIWRAQIVTPIVDAYVAAKKALVDAVKERNQELRDDAGSGKRPAPKSKAQ